MKNKINIRMIGIALIAIISVTLGITFAYYSLFKKQVRNDLLISAKLLKDTGYFEKVEDNAGIDLLISSKELRVTWVNEDGRVLYDNDADMAIVNNHLNRPEIQEAFLYGQGEIVRKSDTRNKNTFYYAIRLDNNTVIRLAVEAESIWYVMLSILPVILAIIIFITLVCVILSHMLTRRLLEPIEAMARDIEDANFSAPYKELAPFADTIRQQHIDILSAAKARQDFTANVSHELKTPLTAILGSAELLEGGIIPEEKKHHFYQEIIKNSERLLALINDIIRLSELDRSEKKPVFSEIDLYEIICEGMENLRISADRRKIKLEFSGEHCKILGNSEMIRELTENLVQNAIRYNNPDGYVKINISNNKRPALTVSDNGIGIPKNEQERVFERFYRVDKSRSKATGGTGLGLAIVKHIVELHDAKIELKSELNKGTTIQVLF